MRLKTKNTQKKYIRILGFIVSSYESIILSLFITPTPN